MKKSGKVQRIDSTSTHENIFEDEDEVLVKNSTFISLQSEDHETSTPWINSTLDHTYDVKTGEFNIFASEEDGPGLFSVKIKTKHVYDRVGIHRSIPDIKSTIKTVKLLQKSELKGGDVQSLADGDGNVGDAGEQRASEKLSTLVEKEIEKNVKYGSSKVINVRNDQTKETTEYNILLAIKSGKLFITFKSIESEKITGERSASVANVSSIISSLLGVSDEEFTSAENLFATIGNNEAKCEFFTAKVSNDKKHVVISAILPYDSFTSDTDIYCEVFKVFIS